MEKVERDKKTGLIPCPICDTPTFEYNGGYEFCHVCGWFDDGIWRLDFGSSTTQNGISVNVGRAMWQVAGKLIKTKGKGRRRAFIGMGKPRVEVPEEEYQEIMVKVNELLSKNKKK